MMTVESDDHDLSVVLLLRSLSTLCESVGIAELSFDVFAADGLWSVVVTFEAGNTVSHLYFLSGAFLPAPLLLL